jgi:hypothetical protein
VESVSRFRCYSQGHAISFYMSAGHSGYTSSPPLKQRLRRIRCVLVGEPCHRRTLCLVIRAVRPDLPAVPGGILPGATVKGVEG